MDAPNQELSTSIFHSTSSTTPSTAPVTGTIEASSSFSASMSSPSSPVGFKPAKFDPGQAKQLKDSMRSLCNLTSNSPRVSRCSSPVGSIKSLSSIDEGGGQFQTANSNQPQQQQQPVSSHKRNPNLIHSKTASIKGNHHIKNSNIYNNNNGQIRKPSFLSKIISSVKTTSSSITSSQQNTGFDNNYSNYTATLTNVAQVESGSTSSLDSDGDEVAPIEILGDKSETSNLIKRPFLRNLSKKLFGASEY